MLINHVSPSRLSRLREQGFSYQGHTYQIDAKAHTAIVNKAAVLQFSPTSVSWRDKDNIMVDFTAISFIEFAVAADTYLQSILQEQWT